MSHHTVLLLGAVAVPGFDEDERSDGERRSGHSPAVCGRPRALEAGQC
jgi:hypothetical protein